MKTDKQKIVFITPSLARTGSEMLLFHFINFLAADHDISVICFKRGDLIKDLKPSVIVHVIDFTDGTTVFQKIKRRFKIHYSIPQLFTRFKNHNWYINTILLPIPVEFALTHKIDFTLHVHELEHRYGLLNGAQLSNALNGPKRLIANSSITKQHLIKAGSKKQIEVIHPFIDLAVLKPFKFTKAETDTRKFKWVMAGSIDENKNPELFVTIARGAKTQNLPYTFTWLYQTITDEHLFSVIKKTITQEQLSVEFVLTSEYKNYIEKFSEGSGLLLSSTYESFSLVTLEALALNLALVLTDCGGVKEIVSEEMASIVPLRSAPQAYLESMKKELNRSNALGQKKAQRAENFDKAITLTHWKNLFLKT